MAWKAIADISKRGYTSYPSTIYGEYFVEGDTALMVVDANYRNPTITTIFKFKDNQSYAKEVIIHARGDEKSVRKAESIIEDVYGKGYVTRYDFRDRSSYEREDGRGEGIDGRGDFEQNQQRTNTLTDREVLTMAAERLEGTPNLTEGERDALRIFRKRKEVLRRVLKKISKPIC